MIKNTFLRDIAPETILSAIEVRRSKRTQLSERNAVLHREIEEFTAPRTALQKENSAASAVLDDQNETLSVALKARTILPEQAKHLRKRVAQLRLRAASKTITVGSAERLRVKLSEAEADLKKACTHPFMLRTDSWDRHDDLIYGKIVCVLCGRKEYDVDKQGYSTSFPMCDTRIIRRIWNEVSYPNGPGALSSDKYLDIRLAEYQALPDADAVMEMFFGDRRMAGLLALLNATSAVSDIIPK